MSGTTGQERCHTASYLGYIDASQEHKIDPISFIRGQLVVGQFAVTSRCNLKIEAARVVSGAKA